MSEDKSQAKGLPRAAVPSRSGDEILIAGGKERNLDQERREKQAKQAAPSQAQPRPEAAGKPATGKPTASEAGA